MNLVVEIGNTALKAAYVQGTVLGKTFRYQGERKTDYILSIIDKEKPEILVIASYRSFNQQDENRLRSACGTLVLLDPDHHEILERYGIPEYLSSNRAASVIAVRHTFKDKGCTVVDFGTALTVDIVDSEGNYLGGNISLGCRTRFKALNRYSVNIPLIDTPKETAPIGNSLQTSIESGIISGIMFEINAYISAYPENIIVFTGGDAIYFVNKMKNSIFAVCNLVLMGLAIITDDYVRQNFS